SAMNKDEDEESSADLNTGLDLGAVTSEDEESSLWADIDVDASAMNKDEDEESSADLNTGLDLGAVTSEDEESSL
ncbi:hypothetical protein, partial [Bacillus infantis]